MAPPAAPPNPAAVPLLGRVRAWAHRHGYTTVLNALSLLVIWGATGFIWGSLDVWAKHLAYQRLQGALAVAAAPYAAWLAEPLAGLEALVADPLLQQATQTPLGLASPAAQRVLNQRAVLVNDPDLVLTDLASGRTILTPGSTTPPPEVFNQLTALHKAQPGLPKVVASGSRNAMLYYALPLPVIAGQEAQVIALALRPISLRQLAGRLPPAPAVQNIILSLYLPHASGQAMWLPTDPLRLNPLPPAPAMEALVQELLLKNMAGIRLQAVWQGPLPFAAGLIKGLLVLWALAASVTILWQTTAPIRAALSAKVTPVLGPVLGPVNQLLHQHLATPMHKANGLLQKINSLVLGLLPKLAGLLALLGPLLPPHWRRNPQAADPNSWRQTGTEKNATALTDGPGGYIATDFSPTDFTSAGHSPQRPAKIVLKPLHTNAAPAVHTSNHHAPAAALVAPSAATPATPPLSPDDAAEQQLALQARVLRCVQEGGLELQYQPIYRAADDTPYANEVLARLSDNEGVISPADFMPVLTNLRRVADLDTLVFGRVLTTHFAGNKPPPTLLSLNISGNSLEDLGYLSDVAKQGPSILRHLVFEVRSNEVVRDPSALQLLKALQRQGAKIAVDYFGGGTTMIAATAALGLDFIKLDAMRLQATRSTKKEFLEVCMAAAQQNLPVVIEKIEDSPTEAFARRAGAKYLQGYALGKPQPNIITLPLSARMAPSS